MRTRIARAAKAAHPQGVDLGVVERELEQLLAAHGDDETWGSAPKWLVSLRRNIRHRQNRVAHTLVQVLAWCGPARVRDVANCLLAALAPTPVLASPAELYRRETELESRIDVLQSHEVTGAITTAERIELVRTLQEYCGVAEQIEADELTRVYGASA